VSFDTITYVLSSMRRAADNAYPWSLTPTEAGALVAEVERLRERIADFEDDFRKVTSETCAPDERHCSCVPHLRAEVERLREFQNNALHAGTDEVAEERAAVVAWLRTRER